MSRKLPTPQTPSDDVNAALFEGRNHYRAGFKIAENPHGADTVKRAAWRLGWLKERDGK